MAVQSSSPTSKPDSPPPAYTEFAESAPQPQSSTMNTSDGGSVTNMPSTAPFPTHAGYGPTPIAQQTALLPYYDPRSPHALAEAGARARWRFFGAVLWALVILTLVSFVTGYEVHFRHGAWLKGDSESWQSW